MEIASRIIHKENVYYCVVYSTERQRKTEPEGSVSFLSVIVFGGEKVLVLLQVFTVVGDFNIFPPIIVPTAPAATNQNFSFLKKLNIIETFLSK